MLTRIEVNDLLIKNAKSTVEVEAAPPAPLKVRFFCGHSVSMGYMDYETGLNNLMTSICKNWQMVRKLKLVVEFENDEAGVNDDARD